MCVFCKIIEGELPSSNVLQSDEFLAFHDIDPKAPIHVLIVPKKHIESFQEVDSEIMGKMTPFIQEVARILAVDESGYRLVTNIGSDGRQEVPHLHFHLLGGGKLRWDHSHDDPRKAM